MTRDGLHVVFIYLSGLKFELVMDWMDGWRRGGLNWARAFCFLPWFTAMHPAALLLCRGGGKWEVGWFNGRWDNHNEHGRGRGGGAFGT
jgi:hypothetical protein